MKKWKQKRNKGNEKEIVLSRVEKKVKERKEE